ncbi:MAG: UPF0175 family protein [Bacteroidia bacterium]
MSITIPQEYLEAAGMTELDLRLEIALIFYQRRSISLGKAAEMAGLERFDFQQKMAGRKIPVNYSLDELMKDVKTLGL